MVSCIYTESVLYNIDKCQLALSFHHLPDNSATVGAAVGGVVAAMVGVVAVTAVVVITVYFFIDARRKGSIDL